MASVSYKISGKYDGSAVKNAQSGLLSLGNVAGSLKNVFAGLGAVFAVSKIVNFSNDCTNAFMVQEEALNRLSQAASNNNKITEAGLKRIIDYTGKLQGKSIYGDEALQGHAAYLTAMGLEEKQIKKVLNAAVELSSAGVGNLESNVKNLSKTLAGQKGELGELIPEMRNLTKEQLENGEAIDIVSRKYAGFAENLSQNTLKGVTTQYNNLIGDIKEKLGSITGALKFDNMKKMLPILDSINGWLEANKNKIINIFLHLPEVAKATFILIKDMLKKLFTVEGFSKIISIYFNMVIRFWKNTLNVMWSLIKAIGTTIWEPLKTGFEWIAYGIKAAFAIVVNFFINKINDFLGWFTDKINWCIDKINSIREFFGASKLDNIEKGVTIEVKTIPEKPKGVNTDNIDNAWKNLGTSITDGIQDYKDMWKETGKETGKLFGKEFQTFGNKINEITNRKVNTGENKTVKNSDTNTNIQTQSENLGEATKKAGKEIDVLGQIIKSFGEIGEVVNAAITGGWIGIIVLLVTKLISALSSVSPVFNDFINGITYMMKIVAEAIAPFIESIFTPLLNILHILGETLGGILAPIFEVLSILLLPIIEFVSILLEVLSPILKVLSELLGIFILLNPIINIFTFAFNILANTLKFLYNYIIMPVVNFLVKIIAGIGNTFIAIWNAIVDVLNGIDIFGWKPFSLSRKNYIDTNSITLKAIEDKPMNSGSTNHNTAYNNKFNSNFNRNSNSKGASYTAAKDIYVNIYYQHSYVNGDAREIALNIRNEIKKAERLGY